MALKAAARVIACAWLLAVWISPAIASQDTLVHKPAPEFTRRDLAGNTVRLGALKGKVVLLNFWATWCAPCRQELPRFAAWQRTEPGLQVIAVSMDDDPPSVFALARKLNLDFPVLMGDAELGTRYGGILGLPVTFLIDRNGTVAARYEGAAHLDQMRRQLDALLASH